MPPSDGIGRRGSAWLRPASYLAIAAVAFLAGVAWRDPGASRAAAGRTSPTRQKTRRGAGSLPPSPAAARKAPEPSVESPATLPGEFEPQSAVLLACQELLVDHGHVFRDIVAALHPHVPVVCLLAQPDQQLLATALLEQVGVPAQSVRFLRVGHDTQWIRDYGPMFLRGGNAKPMLLDSDYTPGGEGQDIRWRDDKVPVLLGEALGLPVRAVPLRVGSGMLLTNGRGLCVTTTRLLHENDDRGFDAARIESLLRKHLGCTTWLCLPPLVGEETGHADVFLTFLAPDLAVVAECDPAADPANSALLDRAALRLAGQVTPLGPLRVERISTPPRANGIWRSYTNVLLGNGVLLVPTFTDVDPALQDRALDTYAALLPGRKIVAVNADSLVATQGLLHCISLNVPAFVPLPPRAETRPLSP